MTINGWDASDYDWARGPMDVAAARADGIDFFTHKATDGTGVKHTRYGEALRRARDAGMPLLGAYAVVRTPGNYGHGSVAAQVDYLLAYVEQQTPWWRDHPGWFWQVDLEKWEYDAVAPKYGVEMCQRLRAATGKRVILYAPKWAYGDSIPNDGTPLWASSYGTNPAVHYPDAYPGDTSSRWVAYSGRTPAVLQFGSRTTIGTQTICDANAFRGTLDQLRALLAPNAAPIFDPVAQPAPSTQEDTMLHGQVPAGDQVIIVGTPWAKSQISFGCDFGRARLRVAEHEVNGGWYITTVDLSDKDAARKDLAPRPNIDRRSIMRVPIDDNDKLDTPIGYLAWLV